MTNLRIFLTYGLPLGLFFIALTIISYLLDIDTHQWLGYVTWIVMLVAAVYSIVDVRKKLGGYISFSFGFKVAFITLFTASVISSIYFFIHVQLVHPNYVDALIEAQRTEMINQGISPETVERALSASSTFNSPAVFIPIGIITNAVVAAVISALTAVVIKREEK